MLAAAALWGAPEDDVKAADLKWAAAVVAADLPALEKIYTPELIYAHSTGVVEDKATYLGRLKSGKQKYTGIDIEKTSVVVYADSAVAHSWVRTRGTNDKGPFNDHLMMLHLWVKRGGAWRLAAHQTTRVP